MGLLETLGWSRRTAKPVGGDLETGEASEERGTWTTWLLRGGLFLGLVVLTVAAFPRGDLYEYTVDVGDTWQQSTLIAPFNFPIYLDQDRVEAMRDTARRNTPPYFRNTPTARQEMAANRDTLRRQLDRILEAYASHRYHREQNRSRQARRDSNRYVQLRRNAQVTLSTQQWEFLAKQYVAEVQGLASTSRSDEEVQATTIQDRLLGSAFDVGTQLLNFSFGVMDRPRDSVYTDEIIIRDEEERTQRTVSKDNLYGLIEAYDYAQKQFQESFSENPEYSRIAYALFRAIFEPSLHYMRNETLQARNRRARNVTAIQGGVERGEAIVRQGERVTEEVKRKLTSLERARSERVGPTIVWRQVSGETLFAVLGFTFFFLYLYLLRPEIWRKDRDMVIIAVIMAFILAMFGGAVRASWSLYVVPVALASVLLTVVFNSRIALFGTLVLAFAGGQMLGLDLEYTLATFFAGSFGIFSVRDIKNRGQFVVSAVLVFVGYVLVLTATWLYLDVPVERFGRDLAYAGVGSALTIVASFFLWALERAFDITTDLTLLELSDTNRPLLKELSLRAPGSFNHTLQVANLAEAAADRVGAHTLLTRVGALYHDIGKMLKPEYFVENQRAGSNPHDRIKPRMSALIIASHVKEGLEMGKEHNMPEEVLKFIPMHHGTARIEYFYQKAVGRSGEKERSVPESEFRYPGPKPDSKEAGILMLADSVEAASRSLDDPTPRRLENLIDLIFRERIDDGQLDDTDLTFRDLRLIKDTFLKMLLGVYHVRVKYPGQDEDEADQATFQVVSLRSEAPYVNVSVAYVHDAWSEREEDEVVSSTRTSRQPRPELAEASPHSRAERVSPELPDDQSGANGAPESSESPQPKSADEDDTSAGG